MKTCFRVSILGLLMFAIVAVSNQTTLAQSDVKLYEKFTENYNGNLAQQKVAVEAGKEFIRKFENSEDDKVFVDYLKEAVPQVEQLVAAEEKRLKDEADRKAKADARRARLGAFDKAYKANDLDAAFAAGDAILQAEPDFYDVAIVLASLGYDQAFAKNDKYNDLTIKNAKLAIAQMEANVPSKSSTYGGYNEIYKTPEFADGRANAMGWMNFYVGWIKFYRQKQKDDAIPYFFKSTQYTSGAQEYPTTYQAIGAWYVSKAADITTKRNAVLTQRNEEAQLATPDPEKIKSLDLQIDEMIAMERAYADRAIDAYSRTYSLIPSADRAKDYGKGIFGTLQGLYKFRYDDKPEMQSDTKINMNVSMVKTKAMPDPSTDVEPVMDSKPETSPTETSPATTKSSTGASRSRTVSDKVTTDNF